MTETAILVENLSKRYRIGEKQERYKTFRDTLVNVLKGIGNRSKIRPSNTIWALKDVTFDVRQGEVIGVIGRNGAGKSTLLKILSRITKPTTGHARVYGRVGSLLEVGTGFHPELTGRENIYLNGAIIGMKRSEIERKFDEIVAFAEIDRFLDTPVKRYSSGMYVRLAFAVAAHLEPEILLVDEVLAVGDAAFQKKCLGKMGEVAVGGRTVLFVSHNMSAISNLCQRCVLLQDGQVHATGPTSEVIEQYLSGFQASSIHSDSALGENQHENEPGDYDLAQHENTYQPGQHIIKRLQLLNAQGKRQDSFMMGQPMTVKVFVEGMSDYRDASIGIIFKTRDDQLLTGISTAMAGAQIEMPRQRKEIARLHIPQIPFTPGIYNLSISVSRGSSGRMDYVERAAQLTVIEADIYGTGHQVSGKYGVFFLNADWEIGHAEKL